MNRRKNRISISSLLWRRPMMPEALRIIHREGNLLNKFLCSFPRVILFEDLDLCANISTPFFLFFAPFFRTKKATKSERKNWISISSLLWQQPMTPQALRIIHREGNKLNKVLCSFPWVIMFEDLDMPANIYYFLHLLFAPFFLTK